MFTCAFIFIQCIFPAHVIANAVKHFVADKARYLFLYLDVAVAVK